MSDNPQYNPTKLVADVMGDLSVKLSTAITVDATACQSAYIHAAGLLLALGITPDVDPGDTSAAAGTVREVLLEDATRTRTRPRHAV